MFYISLIDVKKHLPENYLGKTETYRNFDGSFLEIHMILTYRVFLVFLHFRDSLESQFYMLTFRNTLSVPSF